MRDGLLSGQVFSHFGGQRSKVKVTEDKKRSTSAVSVSLAWPPWGLRGSVGSRNLGGGIA